MPFVEKKFVCEKEMQVFLFLMRTLNLSQADSQKLVHKFMVRAGDTILTSPATVIVGDVFVTLFEPAILDIEPIMRNDVFMVFDKPSGMLVHPTNRWTPISMLDAIRHHGGANANPVHRIDQETSGLLVSSVHKNAEIFLKSAFENRLIQKSYLAWVDGRIDSEFEVNEPILKRHNYDFNKHKVEINSEGKIAQTRFIPMEYDEELDATLLRCEPHTGRMHQIRVHLFHVKHPILGDPLYGTTFEAGDSYLEKTLSDEDRAVYTGANRLMLHAQGLSMPFGGEMYHIESEVDFMALRGNITPKRDRRFNMGGQFKV